LGGNEEDEKTTNMREEVRGACFEGEEQMKPWGSSSWGSV